MTRDRSGRTNDPWKKAEAAFKPAAPKAGEAALAKRPSIPAAREMVSLRIDRDVLEHFQNDGPGWQDRINAVLREASGLDQQPGLRPEDLNSENDI